MPCANKLARGAGNASLGDDMANPESFIEEVTEELRRDRLFGFFKRYGWVLVLAVLLLVAGAAYHEWTKAQDKARAEAFGDALVSALSISDVTGREAALRAVEPQGAEQALILQLVLASTGVEAPAMLLALSEDPAVPALYQDLAALKAILAGGSGDPAQDVALLEDLATPGAPFRAIALELQGVALIEAGQHEAAILALRDAYEEPGGTVVSRRRIGELILAIGGTLDPV